MGRCERLVEDSAGRSRVLFEISGKFPVNHVAYKRADFHVAKAGFGLAFKLGFLKLYAHNGSKPFAEVFAGKVFIRVFQNIKFASIVIHHTGKCALKSIFMRAAVCCMNVVCKCQDKLVIAVVVLHGNFRRGGVIRCNRRKINHVGVNYLNCFFLVNVFYKASNTACINKIVFTWVFRISFVGQDNAHPCVEKRLFTQTGLQGFIVIFRCFLKDLRIGLKTDTSACFFGCAADFQFCDGLATLKALKINIAVLVNFDFEPFGKRIDNRCANTMQTAGNFIPAAAKFATRMQNCKNDRNGRDSRLVVDANRNTAAVVRHADNIAGQNGNVDFVAISRKGLINRVVNDFVDKVVKAARTGRADIHARALTDSFQSFQNLYFTFIIVIFRLCNFTEIQNKTPLQALFKTSSLLKKA